MCLTQLNAGRSSYHIELCSVGRSALLKSPCPYSKHLFNKLWHLHANMQTCKHAHRTITLSECNVAVSITVAVSYNTEDQSPACTSFCSLACLSGTACCHGVSGMACSFGLHTKPAAVGSILLPLTTDIPLNHP